MVTGGDISAAYKELAKRSGKRRDMVCAEGAQLDKSPQAGRGAGMEQGKGAGRAEGPGSDLGPR